MKKILSSITISFLLMFIAGCTIVHNPAPAPATASTQTVEVKKENKQGTKENKRGVRPQRNNKPVGEKNNNTQTVTTTTPKTVNNKPVVQKSNPTQTVTTKPPKPVVSTYKLKVTLTDIQCINGRDGGGSDPDDYGIQQYIVYKALGKDKKFVRRDINKFPIEIDLGGQVPGIINMLINGGESRQIHVREDGDIKQRNRNMISNSLVFHVTSNELNDANASFKIFTWFKEYSTKFRYTRWEQTDDKVLLNNAPISVKVKDVIEILSGSKRLNATTNYHDLSIGKGVKFHNFGSGFMHLANIQKITPMVLEGPIRVGKPGEKAAVWVQFELLD